jgi:hypothetical protein
MAAPDHGLGTTVTFATSAFSANIISVDVSQSRGATETTHMGTTGDKSFIPFDLVDNETMVMEIQYDGSLAPPIDQAVETITIDWAGVGVGHKTAFSGFAISFSASGPIEDLMTGSLTVQRTGAVTIS